MQNRENIENVAEKGKKPIKRVLALCDFACASGFAQVAQNIVAQVLADEEYDYYFDIVAINYYGLPNEWSPYFPRVRLFPASLIAAGDLFGRQGFINMLAAGVYDIAWVLQDTFIVETIAEKIIETRNLLAEKGKKIFKFIYYYPIDAPPKENWIQKSVSFADIPVVYTNYGYNESVKFDPKLKDRLLVVPHGIDEKIFRSAPQTEIDDFRQIYFEKMAEDKFIITNLNRNQPRKDIARTLQIFALVKRQIPEALLYLHMKNHDVAYNIDEAARNYELIPEKDYITPDNFDENQGMPIELVNMIYNASNLVMTTTFGEGWGLSMTEAMAVGTPIIAPNNTSLTEMLADDRGVLVESGKTANDWILLPSDNERLRPIVSVTDYVDKIVKIRNNYKEYKDKALIAQQYLLNNWTWDKVGKQWRDIFKKAIPTEKKVVIGRNDPCTCGSGKKYKVCHGRE